MKIGREREGGKRERRGGLRERDRYRQLDIQTEGKRDRQTEGEGGRKIEEERDREEEGDETGNQSAKNINSLFIR